MALFDLMETLGSLSKRRPIFHSEADFQHELAWEIRSKAPSVAIRLEVPSLAEGVGTTDLVVRSDTFVCGIELKYLTKKLTCAVSGEVFNLKAHGATDLRRYDVFKDIQRLENFNKVNGGPSYIVALTNDPAYWRPVGRNSTIDADFRLCDGREVSGELRWRDHASAGSIKGRELPLRLLGLYPISWQDYSVLPEAGFSFRYLCIEVS